MEVNKEQFLAYLNTQDTFCRHNGIQLTDVEKGFAKAQAIVTATCLNALGIAQGGFVYTLADFTLAAASYGQEKIGVSMHCNISYFKQSKLGEKLVAVSREDNRTKNTATYTVRVYAIDTDEEFIETQARLVASFTGILGLLVPRTGQPTATGISS